MINFIICDDNKKINENINKIVDKVMMKTKLEYHKHNFLDYNKEFFKVMKQKMSNKIYILDIETPSASGIDVVRKIREKDIDSLIIFLTSHDELGYTILKSEFMFLSFICKFDDYEKKLTASIKKAIRIVGEKQSLRLTDHSVVYTIPLSDILYLYRDSVDRKTIIKTDYSEFRVNKPLSELIQLLNGSFKHSHRSCIVNMDRIISVDKKNNVIMFDGGETIDMVNSDFKKELEVVK